MSDLRIAFAGDRDIAVWVLRFLLDQDVHPLALLVPDPGRASHADELVALCPFLEPDHIVYGRRFRQPDGIALLQSLELDYVVGVHFPYLVPEAVLTIPHIGVLNLHPAYLPFNRGWHTPSWALLENTPIGATLHFMDQDIDTGDIIHQKQLEITPGDTANGLYQRIKALEFEVFKEAWPMLVVRSYRRKPQDQTMSTIHKREELFTERVRRIDLDETVNAGDLIRRLRALTTNAIGEAAYYEVDGKRYRIQAHIDDEDF